MSKNQDAVLRIATTRGWRVHRRGGHEQMILVHPPTGARTAVWSTPKTTPSDHQISNKLATLERSGRSALAEKVVDWICKKYGISAGGSGQASFRLKELAREYAGAGADSQTIERVASAIGSSHRIWLADYATRGIYSTPSMRLICGANHLLTEKEYELVSSFPQINGSLPGQKSVSDARREMEIHLRHCGWVKNGHGTYDFKGRRGQLSWKKMNLAKAYEKSLQLGQVPVEPSLLPMPPITVPTVEVEPEVGGVTLVREDEVPARGVFVKDFEKEHPPVVSAPEVKASSNGGVRLSEATKKELRTVLGLDNSDTLTSLDMAREALLSANTAVQEALAALDLVKVTE